MLEITHLIKSFGTQRALDDVSLTLPQGQIAGLFGANGAGKTTLMKSILGFHPYHGQITLDGAPITPAAVRALQSAGVAPVAASDYTAHRARTVTAELLAGADEVIAITAAHAMELMMRFPEHAAKIETFPLDIADPYGGDDATYRACLDMLSCAIALRWFSGSEA